MMNASLLSGIRILDMSRVMSGPFCTSMLADLGAEVIKVELPSIGDEGRGFGPHRDGESTYFMMLNRNKKSVTIDLRTPEGAEMIKSLARQFDVLVENFRPGIMEKYGLSYAAIKAENPRIVYASISGFGQDSPLRDRPAFDLVIQAMSGIMSLTGPRGGPATAIGESLADVCSGIFAAWGIASALFARERSGAGQHVDVAMLDCMVSMQLTGLSRQLYFNDTPKPVGNRHPLSYPVDSFPTTEGDIVLVCFSNALFTGLAGLIGRPDMGEDPDLASHPGRSAREDEVRAAIAKWTRTRSRQEVLDALQAIGIPAAPVMSLDETVKSDHAAARRLVRKGTHTRFGEVPMVPQPVRFSSAPDLTELSTPALGEQTDEVLSQMLGLGAEKLKMLRDKKII